MSCVQSQALSKLLCINCKKYLSHFPIYLHQERGSICGRCPIPTGGNILQNETYENLAQTQKFPCCYDSNGCTENLLPISIPEHEKFCYFRKYVCPTTYYTHCTWQGFAADLLDHFEQKHVTFLLNEGQFEIDFINNHQENYLLPFGENLYIVNRMTDSREGYFACTVTYVGNNASAENNNYKLILRGGNNNSDVHVLRNKLKTTTRINGDVIRDILNDPMSVIAQIEIEETLEDNTNISLIDDQDDGAVNYELLRELECLVCMEYMVPPIHQCLTGHSICLKCKNSVNECPTCKQEFKNTQNFVLAQVINLIVYPCKHPKCKFTAKAKDIKQHEASCVFGPFACPLKEYELCNAEMSITELYDHIVNNHFENLLEIDTIEEPFDRPEDGGEPEDVSCCFIIKHSFRLFKLHYLYENDRFCWAMQLIGPAEESVKYKFEIDIFDASGGNRRVYLKNNCSPLSDKAQAFMNENSYVYLDLEQISPMITEVLCYRIRILQE